MHGQPCVRLLACCETRESKDGDVVVLAEVYRGLGGLGRIWIGGKQSLQPREAVDLAIPIARFQQAVGVESKVIADPEANEGFFIIDAGLNA